MVSVGTYGFINAKVRAMRSFLLKESDYRAMAAAQSVQDLLSVLSQTPFVDMVERLESKNPQDIEQELLREEIRRLRVIEKKSRGECRRVVSLFLERYDAEKLKALFRMWHGKGEKETRILREKVVYDFPVDGIVAARGLEEVIALLEGTPFQRVLAEAAPSYQERKTLFTLELAIDRDLFGRFWDITESLNRRDRRIARRLLGLEVDLENLNWIGRFRAYYNLSPVEIGDILLPHGYRIGRDDIRDVALGGDVWKALLRMTRGTQIDLQENLEEGAHLDALEHVLYVVLHSEARRAFKEFPFSIGSIMGYVYLVRIEMKNVKTLLYAKEYGLSPEEVEVLLLL